MAARCAIILGFLLCAACESGRDEQLAQVSMTPMPRNYTPEAMKTIGSAQPTPNAPD